MLFLFYTSWRHLGLRGLSKYVVNDGVPTRVDYENEEEEEEEEEEEGERSVEDPGGICTTFEISFHLFMRRDWGLWFKVFLYTIFLWGRSSVIDDIQDYVTLQNTACCVMAGFLR